MQQFGKQKITQWNWILNTHILDTNHSYAKLLIIVYTARHDSFFPAQGKIGHQIQALFIEQQISGSQENILTQLTHCGLVMSYSKKELVQHWLR